MDTISGIEIPFLIVGIVELAKQLFNTDARTPIKGNVTIALALVVGGILYGVAAAAQYGVLDTNMQKFVSITFQWILRMLSVPGLFAVVKDRLLPVIGIGR